MNPRGEFLQAFFRKTEQRGVPCCVLRNYDNLFADKGSDVDLVAEPQQVKWLHECLSKAASDSGHQLVSSTRYINFSFVYWHEKSGFLRVDVETEQRWRIFPVLSARAIIGLRRKLGDFFIPHPRHESVVLFLAAIWRGSLSDRYRKQLAELYGQIKEREELQRTFRAVFGSAGDALTSAQARILQEQPKPSLLIAARKAIMRKAFQSRAGRRALLGNLVFDARRAGQRLRNPPGIFLVHVSSAQPARSLAGLLASLEFLFPAGKSALHVRKHSPGGDTAVSLSWALRLARLRAILKGGIFALSIELSKDPQIAEILKAHGRYCYKSRTFFCLEGDRINALIAHVGSGFMDERESNSSPTFEDWAARFIASILTRQCSPDAPRQAKGLFIVLLGLDGSGKTTVARKLCCLARQTNSFQRARYFHWRPSLAVRPEFPLPSAENVPRKSPDRPYPLRSAVSALRLLKNLLLTRLVWNLRTQDLLRNQSLVLMDRYFFNYYLDPVSVRYYGPRWLVDKVRPAYPQPDLIAVLKAPAATLLARKQELSEQEIRRQDALLDQLALDVPQSMVVDASRPAEEVARTIMERIVSLPGQGLVVNRKNLDA